MVREEYGEQQSWKGDDPCRSFVETSPELFFRLNEKGEVVLLSPTSRSQADSSSQPSIGCRYSAFISPEDQALAEKSFELVLNGVRKLEVVLQLVYRDGRRIRAVIHARPWLDGENIVGVQGQVRHVFEPQDGQAREQKARPKYRASVLPPLFDNSAFGRGRFRRNRFLSVNELEQVFNVAAPFCLLSLDCRILKVNQAFGDFFNCGQEEVIGASCLDIWGCDVCNTEECPLRQLVAGADRAYRKIDRVVQGRHLVCTLHIVPYRDNAGRLNGMVVTFFDTREQKKTSADLIKTQQQLIQADKLSAIGSLAASIAHEFNNPLCGVRSVVERMARKSGLADAEQGLLGLALEQCDRMKRLIQNLQQFNLPFSDVRKEFDLHYAIDSVLLLLNKHLQIRRATVRKEYAEGVLMLTGVENQIKQVLLNLIKNSGEALTEAGGVIRVLTRRGQQTVQVVISDTGVGISEEHLPHLFEPFFTTKTAVKETGLGLAVSYGIIKGHQGEVRVESTPGQGTTFTVILPDREHGG